jgi:uncharacterized protein
MFQRWHDLLFAHWPVDASELQKLLPSGLEIDLFEGAAWVGLVPFRMTSVRLRFLPAYPPLSNFPEMNVRTYVRYNGVQGVYFFSLDAACAPAVHMARAWFKLPYHCANMICRDSGAEIQYESVRTHRGSPPAEFRGSYGPSGPAFPPVAGSLESWLTARYYLFTRSGNKSIISGAIHHRPWPIQPAFLNMERETAIEAAGIIRPNCEPYLLFARQLDVLFWAPSSDIYSTISL